MGNVLHGLDFSAVFVVLEDHIYNIKRRLGNVPSPRAVVPLGEARVILRRVYFFWFVIVTKKLILGKQKRWATQVNWERRIHRRRAISHYAFARYHCLSRSFVVLGIISSIIWTHLWRRYLVRTFRRTITGFLLSTVSWRRHNSLLINNIKYKERCSIMKVLSYLIFYKICYDIAPPILQT